MDYDLVITIAQSLAEFLLPNVRATRVIAKDTVLKNLQRGMSIMQASNLLREAILGTGRQKIANIDAIKRGIAEFLTTNANNVYYDSAGITKDTMMIWVLGANTNHCPDCLENAGLGPKPKSFWDLRGKPGEGATWCGPFCNCSLKVVTQGGKRGA